MDDALRALLRAAAFSGSNVDVVFDAPQTVWSEPGHTARVDAYLYSIVEDLSRRPADFEDVRDEQGRVTARRPPQRRYRLHYLLTAWAGTTNEEHRLLSQLLAALAEEQVIPEEHIAGDLASAGVPVYLSVAVGDKESADPWSLWRALGVPPRAALDLVVTAPLPRVTPVPTAEPVRRRIISAGQQSSASPEMVPSQHRDEALQVARGVPRTATARAPAPGTVTSGG